MEKVTGFINNYQYRFIIVYLTYNQKYIIFFSLYNY